MTLACCAQCWYVTKDGLVTSIVLSYVLLNNLHFHSMAFTFSSTYIVSCPPPPLLFTLSLAPTLTELQVCLLSNHILHSPSSPPSLHSPLSISLPNSVYFLSFWPPSLSILLSLPLPPSPYLSLPPSPSLPSLSLLSLSLLPSYFGVGDGVCCQFHHGKVSFPDHLLKLVEPDRCLLTRACHDI